MRAGWACRPCRGMLGGLQPRKSGGQGPMDMHVHRPACPWFVHLRVRLTRPPQIAGACGSGVRRSRGGRAGCGWRSPAAIGADFVRLRRGSGAPPTCKSIAGRVARARRAPTAPSRRPRAGGAGRVRLQHASGLRVAFCAKVAIRRCGRAPLPRRARGGRLRLAERRMNAFFAGSWQEFQLMRHAAKHDQLAHIF